MFFFSFTSLYQSSNVNYRFSQLSIFLLKIKSDKKKRHRISQENGKVEKNSTQILVFVFVVVFTFNRNTSHIWKHLNIKFVYIVVLGSMKR